MRILLAWDPLGNGKSDPLGAVYTLTAPFATSFAVGAVKSTDPIQIPAENRPEKLDDLLVKFSLKPGGIAITDIADFTFQVFQGSQLIYSVAPGSDVLKVKIHGLTNVEISFQATMSPTTPDDTVAIDVSGLSTVSAEQVFETLMSPDGPLF
jgi:hypothetical protein